MTAMTTPLAGPGFVDDHGSRADEDEAERSDEFCCEWSELRTHVCTPCGRLVLIRRFVGCRRIPAAVVEERGPVERLSFLHQTKEHRVVSGSVGSPQRADDLRDHTIQDR
jgi:hypothetical protein